MPTPLDQFQILEYLRPTVSLVQDLQSGERRVVKELVPDPSLNEHDLARRQRMLNAALPVLGALTHPNLVSVRGHFYYDRNTLVVLEHVQGQSLLSLVPQASREEVVAWAAQVCRAIAALHDRPRPFILGKLEFSDLLVTAEGRVKLVNLGLSRYFAAPDPVLSVADDQRAFRLFFEELVGRHPGLSRWAPCEQLIGELRLGRFRSDFAELAVRLCALAPVQERPAPQPSRWDRLARMAAGLLRSRSGFV